MAGRVRHHGEVQPGEEGNNLMWLLDFKLDFFNDAEAKEKGKQFFLIFLSEFLLTLKLSSFSSQSWIL